MQGKLTSSHFIITDHKGNTVKTPLEDITSIRVKGLVMKVCIVGTRHGGFFNMASGGESQQIAAWIRGAAA